VDVFDTRVLHRVELAVDAAHLGRLESDPEGRVPCSLTFDGVVLPGVGARVKGFIGSRSPLSGKPAFSLRLDAFAPGQRLGGLERLLLNNAQQDPSLLNEHLAYALHRRAGLPAPRTAHALVSLNGRVLGLYVLREAWDGRALREAFGPGAGNLYEGAAVDFATPGGGPGRLELKDAAKEGRARFDLEALAEVLARAPDAGLEEALERHLDVEQYLTAHALELLVGHWDGFVLGANNYYLYRRPSDGRFVFLPHGMDQVLDVGVRAMAQGAPRARLAERVAAHPRLSARLRARVLWLAREVWDEGALRERAAQAWAVLQGAPREEPAVRRDLAAFAVAFQDKLDNLPHRSAELRLLLEAPERADAELAVVREAPGAALPEAPRAALPEAPRPQGGAGGAPPSH
jgi:hypothetical protein